jgi:hypothetical protein
MPWIAAKSVARACESRKPNSAPRRGTARLHWLASREQDRDPRGREAADHEADRRDQARLRALRDADDRVAAGAAARHARAVADEARRRARAAPAEPRRPGRARSSVARTRLHTRPPRSAGRERIRPAAARARTTASSARRPPARDRAHLGVARRDAERLAGREREQRNERRRSPSRRARKGQVSMRALDGVGLCAQAQAGAWASGESPLAFQASMPPTTSSSRSKPGALEQAGRDRRAVAAAAHQDHAARVRRQLRRAKSSLLSGTLSAPSMWPGPLACVRTSTTAGASSRRRFASACTVVRSRARTRSRPPRAPPCRRRGSPPRDRSRCDPGARRPRSRGRVRGHDHGRVAGRARVPTQVAKLPSRPMFTLPARCPAAKSAACAHVEQLRAWLASSSAAHERAARARVQALVERRALACD